MKVANMSVDKRVHDAAKEIGFGNASLGYRIAVTMYVKKHGARRSEYVSNADVLIDEVFGSK